LTTDKVCAFSSSGVLRVFFLFWSVVCDWPVACADCVVVCVDWSAGWLPVAWAAAAEVAIMANRDAEMASDRGLLRWMVGMVLPLDGYR